MSVDNRDKEGLQQFAACLEKLNDCVAKLPDKYTKLHKCLSDYRYILKCTYLFVLYRYMEVANCDTHEYTADQMEEMHKIYESIRNNYKRWDHFCAILIEFLNETHSEIESLVNELEQSGSEINLCDLKNVIHSICMLFDCTTPDGECRYSFGCVIWSLFGKVEFNKNVRMRRRPYNDIIAIYFE